METLQQQIAQFRETFRTMVPAENVSIIEKSLQKQKLNRGLEGILKVGDSVSDFSLRDIFGERINLGELLKSGPLVIKFYRGGWCPYCNLELMAYQHSLNDFKNAGANVLALSPEILNQATETADKNRLTFSIATDEELAIARSFGLVFELNEELRYLYRKFNHPLSEKNTNGLWQLPVPATYVIGQDKRVSFASVNLDYRERVEPQIVLDHVRRMSYEYTK